MFGALIDSRSDFLFLWLVVFISTQPFTVGRIAWIVFQAAVCGRGSWRYLSCTVAWIKQTQTHSATSMRVTVSHVLQVCTWNRVWATMYKIPTWHCLEPPIGHGRWENSHYIHITLIIISRRSLYTVQHATAPHDSIKWRPIKILVSPEAVVTSS